MDGVTYAYIYRVRAAYTHTLMFHAISTYIKVLNRFRNVKLVHGRYDDGRSGEKEEQEK